MRFIMKAILFLSFFISSGAHAQFEGLGVLDRIWFELKFGKPSSNKQTIEEYKKDTPKICLEDYARLKEAWLKKYKKSSGVIAVEGGFSGHTFTKDEMLNMPKENQFLKSKIRGTNVVKYETFSSNIGFPHMLPRCKDFYKEEVQKITVGEKACRKVVFTLPHIEGESYAQVYCENSQKLYMTFDSKMEITPESLGESNDCVECTKK